MSVDPSFKTPGFRILIEVSFSSVLVELGMAPLNTGVKDDLSLRSARKPVLAD